ncbi:MAG TPA: nucleoside-diphosphate sugar epimerase/dehydratase [Longimicrobiales bacterium]|nr:nucleoside-diphosphate sugar epimerase/dehydratase [Longimicrobiales bacterium]
MIRREYTGSEGRGPCSDDESWKNAPYPDAGAAGRGGGVTGRYLVITSRFRRAFRRVYPFLARRRKWVALGAYSVLTAFAFFGAYLLRFAADIPEAYRIGMLWGGLVLLPIRVVAHLAFGVTTGRWRYASLPDLGRLVVSTTVGSVVFGLVAWGVIGFDPRIPFGVIVIEWLLTTYLIAGLWAGYRAAYEWIRQEARSRGQVRRVLIVGAGEAGDQLLRELFRAGRGAYQPVGFVDDDTLKVGSSIQGIPVMGGVDDLGEMVIDVDADEILVAVPSAGPRAMRRIVAACQETGLPYRVLPGITAVLRGSVSLDQLRQVKIDDLLGREPVKLMLPRLAADIGGKVVLVTGAAGSIGHELCRQIALHGPSRLVMLDHAESALYFAQREFADDHPDLDLAAVVADVRDDEDLERIFSRHRPDRVFHAAAYKHVPLMEENVRTAVENNVLGTHNVIRTCQRWETEKFVLISTDKAVRPSSVMGASKRAAEILLLRAAESSPRTGWYAVRFGNVLGSAGSVIPIFKKQLGTGRPITVTHEDVTRYFMTIPEAVQLVLQATLLEEARGRIAMLEMGEPVRIMDLARDLIRLAGRIEGVDAEIEIVGLRPGEKLHEELAAPEEEVVPTGVDKIRILRSPDVVLPDPMERLFPDSRDDRSGLSTADLRTRLMGLAADSYSLPTVSSEQPASP